ncbi:prolyl oligopeptidase family serine peptidase [Rhizobacter sp. Root404]|uniref:S9 family peptidase n=1 Tax=Rhizobacter sp. Root404 TaxID=1736528 RepID=UPI0009E732A2|nr:prolyl oligopeptidase family serine peptidase [Rhizobacter sp. Root404]
MAIRRVAVSALAAFAVAALGGCGNLQPATSAAGTTIAPNANLVAQGIPPIPASIADDVARYTEFSAYAFVDWHPTRRELLVSHRPQGASVPQLFRIATPLATPEPLTESTDPVRRARYEPREGRYIVFARGTGGNEQDKLYRLDLPGKQVTLLTDTDERHSMEGWLHAGGRLLTLATPLDRTAAGGTRTQVTQTLSLMDPLQPRAAEKLVDLPGGGWGVGSVSWDDRQVALTRYLSAGESQVWLLDLTSRQLTQLLPASGGGKGSWFAGEFSRDGRGLFVLSDQGSEFRQLAVYDFVQRRVTPVTRDIPWDISGASASENGALIAARANVDGRDELRLYDARTLQQLPPPRLPPGGVVAVSFHPRRPDLAFALNSAQAPSQVWSMNPASGAVEPWTRAESPAGLDLRSLPEQRIVRWPSFDGRTISGVLNSPPARFTGKRPVLIAIHGGPEGQAKLGFIARSNYLVNELGIALIQPNVRGSSGYGKTFLALDDGFRREDSVKDIGALLDWIATQPTLDASRVIVTGGSYGGYMSLAVATTYSDRIAGSIDVVGISNFLSFLKNTESYRRDLRRVEYGDERDPPMRAHLEKISPLTNAAKIRKPLFVVQGRNDPRVPVTEAEQIVAQVRANGSPVWYLRGENEGHGFQRKENADFQFYATVLFMRETLGLK